MKKMQFSWFSTAILCFASFLALAPLFWMVSVSFMGPEDTNSLTPPILPSKVTLENYEVLFEQQSMGRYVLNSLIISTCATFLALSFNITAGYAFAKLRFTGKEKLFQGLLMALVIPGQLSMFPLFFMAKNMGLLNSFGGVLIPFMASLFGILMVRQYALSIPNEMLEAARVDGASEYQVFWHIVLPNLTPIMVTLAIFTFLGAWNDFLWPLIVLYDDKFYTLPLALAGLSREHVQDHGLIMAGAMVTIVPVLLIFLILQRQYVRGLLAGSVKG